MHEFTAAVDLDRLDGEWAFGDDLVQEAGSRGAGGSIVDVSYRPSADWTDGREVLEPPVRLDGYVQGIDLEALARPLRFARPSRESPGMEATHPSSAAVSIADHPHWIDSTAGDQVADDTPDGCFGDGKPFLLEQGSQGPLAPGRESPAQGLDAHDQLGRPRWAPQPLRAARSTLETAWSHRRGDGVDRHSEEVKFEAGQKVVIQDGFTVKPGSTFKVNVMPGFLAQETSPSPTRTSSTT